MRIDRTQRGWAVASLVMFVIATAVYVIYATTSERPRGGSAMGLLFGVIGFALMIFAALLGARKRIPTWRVGRAQAWMRGHLWLGLLSLPVILFHSGFHFGGALTRALMWLLILTVASGVFGAVLQHYLPRVMTADVKLETIYDQIGNVRMLLKEEADRAVESICGSLELQENEAASVQRAGGFSAVRPIAASGAALAVAQEKVLLTEEECAPLRRFYLDQMRPFLESPRQRRGRLGSVEEAHTAFSGLQTLMPPAAHATLADLQDMCDEARQLLRQQHLHRWLHGWMLVHIPLSLTLLVLGAVHAVAALKW